MPSANRSAIAWTATGLIASAGAEPGVEAVGERGVPASEPRSTKGVDERRVVGLGCREGQVGTQGAGEDVRLVVDDRDEVAHLVERQGRHVGAVDGVRPRARVEVAGEHGQEGGLAGAVGAGEGEVLARLDRQVDRAHVGAAG